MSNWIINKYCFINFWLFDDEKIETYGGNLLLNGENGSGKSVTLQSFIPIILDGNTSSNRLSTEGDTSRKIDYYILYGDKKENLSYIYAEFKKGDKYLTYGIGFKLKEGQGSPQKWYFKLEDLRVEGDISLFTKTKDRFVFTKQELKKHNDSDFGGKMTVFETQEEYKSDINNNIFGFRTIEEYDETLKLILELRKPSIKDSSGFDPQFIYDILNNSLKTLSEDKLKSMSDSFENIEKISEKIKDMERQNKGLVNIDSAYTEYNRAVIKKRLENFLSAYRIYNSNLKKIENFEKEIENNEVVMGKDEAKKLRREEEKRNKDARIKELNSNVELKDVRNNYQRAQEDLRKEELREKDKRDRIKSVNEELSREERNIEKNSRAYGNIKDEILKEAGKINNLSYEFFGEKLIDFNNYIENNKKVNLEIINKRLNELKKVINELSRLNEELRIIKEKTENKKQSLSTRNDEILKLKSAYNEILVKLQSKKEALVEEIDDRINSNKYFYFNKNQLDTVEDEIFQKEDDIKLEFFLKTLEENKETLENLARTELIKAKESIRMLESLKTDKKQEMTELKNQEDIKLEISVEREKARETLDKSKSTELYKAVRFRKEVEENTKNSIEKALLDLGILGDLILQGNYKEFCDKYLISDKTYDFSLYDYLEPEENCPIPYEVERLLQSISIDSNDQNFITTDGLYRIGLIEGKIFGEYGAKYIGVEARKKLKEEKIRAIELEIQEIDREIYKGETLVEEIESKLEEIKKECLVLKNLDIFKDIKEIKRELNKTLDNINFIKTEKEKDEKLLLSLEEEGLKREKNIEFIERTNKISVNNYTTVQFTIKEFESELNYYNRSQESLVTTFEIIETAKKRLEYFENDRQADTLELKKITGDIKEIREKIELYRQKLEGQEFLNFEKEITELERLVNFDLPKAIEELTKAIERRKTRIENDRLSLEDEKKKSNNYLKEMKITETLVDYELENDFLRLNEEFKTIEDKEKLLTSIKYQLKKNSTKDNFTEGDYLGLLNNIFEKEYSATKVFNLSISRVGNIAEDIGDFDKESYRYKIEGVYNGSNLSFYSLLTRNAKALEDARETLTEEERQFFEEFLLNEVGRELKRRIEDSRVWVKEIDEIMKKTPTSSGKIYKLSWAGKLMDQKRNLKAERFETLLGDAKATEAQIVKDYFKEKVAEIQNNERKNNIYRSNYEIIKDVLDYRSWFEFKLTVKEAGGAEYNLTKKRLNSYSGGEKVMAVYIPLFSALYARFSSAREESLKILAMDEAFSVVDDDNIEKLFATLDGLGLNFLMASQKLTGTYSTVKKLAIIHIENPVSKMMVDPKDGYITLLKYLWDGKEKKADDRNVKISLW